MTRERGGGERGGDGERIYVICNEIITRIASIVIIPTTVTTTTDKNDKM